jgi:hypothetical protein
MLVRGVEKPDRLLALQSSDLSFDLAFLAFSLDFLFAACHLFKFLTLPCRFGKTATLEATMIGAVVEPFVIPRPVGMALVVVVIPRPVGMALMVVVMFELAVIARPLVLALVILELLVMHLVVVVTVGPVVNALVLPPALVIVMLARYGPKQAMVPDQPVRYLVYAIEWCCDTFSKATLSICSGDVYLVILIS